MLEAMLLTDNCAMAMPMSVETSDLWPRLSAITRHNEKMISCPRDLRDGCLTHQILTGEQAGAAQYAMK
jgi:hypothetical protein